MQLNEVQLDTPGKVLESSQMATATLRAGERGVKDLIELPDGRIRVVGERVTYHLYPSHVVWTVPAASQHCPVVSEELAVSPPAAGAVSDLQSAVAQLVEHDTVNVGDERSNPSGGATELAESNKVQSDLPRPLGGEVAVAPAAVEASSGPSRGVPAAFDAAKSAAAGMLHKPEVEEAKPAQPDDVVKKSRPRARSRAKSVRSKTV